MTKKHCFIYLKDKDEFQEIKKSDIAEQYFNYLSEEPSKIEIYASQNGNEAVLLYENITDNEKWTLVYATGSGIVSQRTARRRADSASRTGILLSTGERIGVNAPLTVLSDSDIGDLSKSVQSKYLKYTNLRGVE